MKRKILMFTDFRTAKGKPTSGYGVIAEGLSTALVKSGHEVKIMATSYDDEEVDYPFAVIPARYTDLIGLQIKDIIDGWSPDVLLVMMDMDYQIGLLTNLTNLSIRYIAIMPIEGEPVLQPWADALIQADSVLTFNLWGQSKLLDKGVMSTVLDIPAPIGVGIAKPDDLKKMHDDIHLDNAFVIMKVADNTTRKNWADTLRVYSEWSEEKDSILYAVTRDIGIGFNLHELLIEFGAEQSGNSTVYKMPCVEGSHREVRVVSGLSRKEIYWLYNLCDVVLMDTGNEGLGMPILEAMAIGKPVIGMDHTSMTELLGDGHGILMNKGYEYRDTFGNVKRYYPDSNEWKSKLTWCYENRDQLPEIGKKEHEWIMKRTWMDAIKPLLEVI